MSAASKPLYFILPEDHHLPSGGNIYNKKLIEALRRAGHTIEILNFSAYQQAIKQKQSGCYWVDSLFIRDISTLPAGKTANVKSFFILHHLESLHPPPGKSSDEVFAHEQAALSFFDGFLATSAFSEKYLRSRGLLQPIVVVEPALDLPLPGRSLQHDQVRALMVANVIERKGILPWLQHLGRLAKASDRFSLTIIGRTDMEPAYVKACRQEALSHTGLCDKVLFTGALPHAAVLQYYARGNLFISASRMETFGMALQEAASYHLPILTLAGGFAKSHVDTGNGGYVFNSTAGMANFFINLARDQVKFTTLQKQIRQRRPSPGTWQHAAALFFQQFKTFLKNQ